MKQKILRISLLLILFGALFLSTKGCASKTGFQEPGLDPLRMGIDFYRGPLDHLNAVRTGTCPMHPSCSSYGKEAIGMHGTLIGWMMTCDRLMRCGRDELRRTRPVFIEGDRRWPDPVSGNDWWWHEPQF
jgi:putative component of membrane protein insertase Oxa1/YidC/SpoIIIJ protein YidD